MSLSVNSTFSANILLFYMLIPTLKKVLSYLILHSNRMYSYQNHVILNAQLPTFPESSPVSMTRGWYFEEVIDHYSCDYPVIQHAVHGVTAAQCAVLCSQTDRCFMFALTQSACAITRAGVGTGVNLHSEYQHSYMLISKM